MATASTSPRASKRSPSRAAWRSPSRCCGPFASASTRPSTTSASSRQEHRRAGARLPRPSGRRRRRRRERRRRRRRSRRARPPARDRVDKPSIAVLPFNNMSGDPEQEFFADGITEDIITELSRFRELFVISRNSSFKLQGPGGRGAEVRRRARRAVRRRGQRAQGRAAGAHHRAADRRRDRPPSLGRALRPRPRGHLRDPGRGHERDRRDPARAGRGGGARPRRAPHHRQHGGLRVRADRQGPAPPQQARRQRPGAAACSSGRSSSIPNYAHAHAWKACVLGQTWVYNWCESRPRRRGADQASAGDGARARRQRQRRAPHPGRDQRHPGQLRQGASTTSGAR